MTVDVLLQQFFNALGLGVMYALIAVGFTLFFGVIEVVNFAHGEVFMLGAFGAMVVGTAMAGAGVEAGSVTYLLAVLAIIIIVGALFGAALEKFIVAPMRGAPDIMTLLITLGASIVVREAVMIFFPDGRNPQPFPQMIQMDSFNIGGALIKPETIICIVISAILISMMYWIIEKTALGRYIRATAQDRQAALMMGVNANRVFIITLILGSVAGLMNGMSYGIIKFNMGFAASIKGFAAAVVGGLGNMYGAVVGGLLLGFLEIFVVSFLPNGSSYQELVAFLIVILCLVFRPSGLFGEKAYDKV